MPTAPRPTGQQHRPPRPTHGWRDNRGTSKQRGYGNDWTKLAKAFKRENPLCEFCLERGVVTEATHADHIVPFQGVNDPLRLDWNNLRALCERCHMARTARDKGGAIRDLVPESKNRV